MQAAAQLGQVDLVVCTHRDIGQICSCPTTSPPHAGLGTVEESAGVVRREG